MLVAFGVEGFGCGEAGQERGDELRRCLVGEGGFITETFGDERYAPMPNPMADAEDFSRVLDAVPGCYVFLGAHVGDRFDGPDNHSPRATFDDAVLTDGALLHARLAVRALRRDAAALT